MLDNSSPVYDVVDVTKPRNNDLYNISKNQGTFPGDFERFKPKNPPQYLEIANISNIKQDNPYNNQALF